MTSEKRDFNKDASTWDEKPERIEMRNAIGAAISSGIPLNKKMKALDFGCGTGLLTLHIAPMVASITGIDTSQGMLNELNAKIATQNIGNATTHLIVNDDFTMTDKYDLIVSSMTIHHIENIEPLIKKLHDMLLPGGYLSIADLDTEEGIFHKNNADVFHFGFDRPEMKTVFTKAGFDNVNIKTVFEVERNDSKGDTKKVSIFLITGIKKPA